MIAERRRLVLVQLRIQFSVICVSSALFIARPVLLHSFRVLLPAAVCCQAAVSPLILVGTSAVHNIQSPQLTLTCREMQWSTAWE